MSESATMLSYCPHCGNKIQISQVRTHGGVDDDGGWVLKCSGCANPFRQHVGRDIQMSRVIWGASVLATYDDNVAGSRNHALEKYGLSENPKKEIAKKLVARRKKSGKKTKKSKAIKRKQ